MTAWREFTAGDWQNGINVRDFIQRNYTPYTGDGAFLAGPTARTLELRGKMDDLLRRERENGGVLKVRYKKPRQNTVKVLLLMDSGGSMDYYAQLCSALFQAVSKSGHFKDLKVFYFHNCVYSRLYTEPTLRPSHTVPTDWVLSNLSSEYKVILVGEELGY